MDTVDITGDLVIDEAILDDDDAVEAIITAYLTDQCASPCYYRRPRSYEILTVLLLLLD